MPLSNPSATDRYSVEIVYREPTYELRRGKKSRPYRYTFEVVASSEDSALRQAVTEFHETAQHSSVGWIREIVSTEVRPSRSDH